MSELGSRYSFVFCGDGNVDEVTTSGPTIIHRLHDGEVTTAEFTPEDFGVVRVPVSELLGGDAVDNAAILSGIFDGEQGPRTDAVLVNAAPALVAAGTRSRFRGRGGAGPGIDRLGGGVVDPCSSSGAKPGFGRRLMHIEADDLLAALRRAGLRITAPRRAVCEILAESHDEHLTAATLARPGH